MKKLTERAAWLVLAKACEEAANTNSCEFDVDGFGCAGLCSGIYYLSNIIGDTTPDRMTRRIDAAMPKRRAIEPETAYLFPVTPIGHAQRAKFCRKQVALLTKKRKKVKA